MSESGEFRIFRALLWLCRLGLAPICLDESYGFICDRPHPLINQGVQTARESRRLICSFLSGLIDRSLNFKMQPFVNKE